MVGRRVKRKGGGHRPEAAFGKAPQQSVGLQVKGCTLAISIRPRLAKPSDDAAGVVVVWNGVGGVGLGKEHGSLVGRVGRDGQGGSGG